jgi:transcription antitermination factor NusG
MEGDKRYRAKIDQLVKQRVKLREGDNVRIMKGENKGKIGFVESIGSLTDIKDVNSTYVQYLIRLGKDLLAYDISEIWVIVKSEQVNFT